MVFLSAAFLSRALGARKFVKFSRPMKGMMRGEYPVTRTRLYLEQGIVFRDCVKIVTIHYGDYNGGGVQNFITLNFNQLQYKNPDVQLLCVRNLTPSPYITFFLDDGEKVHVDIEGMSQIEIVEHIQKAFGKPHDVIQLENKAVEPNPANFGKKFARKCICTEYGQLPCSGSDEVIPFHARDKLSGKRNWNYNPKKYPHGIEEME